MGKSWVRLRRLDDLPLELIGEMIAAVSVEDFIDQYKTAKGISG